MARIKIEGKGEIRRTRIGDCKVLDAQLKTYNSGKFFIQYLYEDLLGLLVEDMKRNIKADYDNVLMCDGGEGSGKSNLIWNVIERFHPGFDIEKVYVYNMQGIRDRFASGDYGGDIFWMDETSQIASNRTWQSEDNQDLVGILETCRSKHMTLCGAVPNISRVDIYLREFRMRYLLRCKPMSFPSIGYRPRGVFELLKRNNETGQMQHIGYGLFDPMPTEAKEKYEPIKAEFQERFRKKIAEGKDKGKYKDKWIEAQNRNTDVMAKLYDAGLVDEDQLMQLFGYENKRTFQNAIYKARSRAKE